MINQICSFPFNFHFISAFGFGIERSLSLSLLHCLWHFELPASFHFPLYLFPLPTCPVNMPLPVPVEAQSSFKNIRNFDLCSLCWLRVGFRLWLFGLEKERERESLWCEWVQEGSVGLSSANFPLFGFDLWTCALTKCCIPCCACVYMCYLLARLKWGKWVALLVDFIAWLG